MRLLSKYCTLRVPPTPSAYFSVLVSPGVGPQYHERTTALSATSLSVRFHVLWKAGSANADCAWVGCWADSAGVINVARAATVNTCFVFKTCPPFMLLLG